MQDVLTLDQSATQSAEDLLTELRAAGLTVFPGPGENDLGVEGERDVLDRYQDAIRAHKAALLAHFEIEAVLHFAREETADIAHGKRFCWSGCPHLKIHRHDWPGPGARTFWCCHAGARLNRLDACPAPDRPTFCAGPDCRYFKVWRIENRRPESYCRWVSPDGKTGVNTSLDGLTRCPKPTSRRNPHVRRAPAR